MKKYLFARIMIDSPNSLKPGYKFVESISSYLSDICDVNMTTIERYYKIEEYVVIEIEIIPKIIKNDQQNILLFFIIVIQKLGRCWLLNGTDERPEALWHKEGDDSYFFRKEVRWADIKTKSF